MSTQAVLLCRSHDPDGKSCFLRRGHSGWFHRGELGQRWSGGVNTAAVWRTEEHPLHRKAEA